MKSPKYIIKDWAGNIKYYGKSFDSFDDAEYFLNVYFNENDMDYEEWRQEYFIDPLEEEEEEEEEENK